jgi:HlyD family secretion protein
MKKVLILIAAGVIALTSVISLKSCSKGGAIEVTAEKAKKRSIIETVSANGKIQPEVEVKISPDVSGEIVELYVKEGDRVKKGDLILKIRPDIYESSLEQVVAALNTSKANLSNSRARLAQVKAQFANTESSYNRTKRLFDQGAVSQSEFDAAKAQYEAAKADMIATEESVNAAEYNVKSAEATVKEANNNLQKTSIYAPVDGTVSKLAVELGERVVGTSQMAGTELLRIANLNEMEVSVDVNENDIVRVHLNDTALIEVDAYLERKFKGIVTEIANSANTTGVTADQVTNFTVKIRILQESYKDLLSSPGASPFRPGMSATVDIQTKRVINVISVPIQAVTTRSDTAGAVKDKEEYGGDEEGDGEVVVKDTRKDETKTKEEPVKAEEYVFIHDNGTARMVKVKTGIQDNDYIEVISGIKEGDEVISGPYGAVSKMLKDGSEVQKVDREALFSVEKD